MKLLDAAADRDLVERELERVRRWYGCFITGYVIMPEHVHLLISEPERGTLSLVVQMWKQITSRKLRFVLAHPPAQNAGRVGQPELKRFWQVRYYGFPVWTEANRIEKLRYIHRNPVTRGLVEHPEDWKWSSFVHDATGVEGVVEIESQWTARKRERDGLPLASPIAHPPAQNAGRVGQPASEHSTVGGPPSRTNRGKSGATIESLR